MRLAYQGKAYTFLGLIDSGADECTFPGAIAEFLGHNLAKGKARVFTGIGGAVVSYLHQTEIEAAGIRFRTNIYYSNEWNKMGFGLLGQAGFFTHFKITLDHRNKEIALSHNR